jgi:hypothetical protein
MGNGESLMGQLHLPADALKRPDYAAGMYLTAQDLLAEQRYRRQRLRRHNRYWHGWGVVCGLRVVPNNDPGQPWAITICHGYALGPYGDEIEVPVPAVINVRDYLWRLPLDREVEDRRTYVGIRYIELEVCPVPTTPPGCGCEETVYRPSRLRDSFQIDALWERPERMRAEDFDLCEQQSARCPECPESPYVVLACITLPACEGDSITADLIDNWSCRDRL